MAVSEYKIDCKYRIGQLKPYFYLIPGSSSTVNYEVDNTNIIVHGATSPLTYKVNALSVNMTSEETLEGRFKFHNVVTANLKENVVSTLTDVLDIIRKGSWRVIVEDLVGNYYIANLDFDAYMTYNYLFTDNKTSPNSCTMTFEVDSNFPVQRMERFIPSFQNILDETCGYSRSGIKSFQLCEYKHSYIVREDNTFDRVYVTGTTDNSFKNINFIKNSFNFRENFDGDKYTHIIQFKIPLDDYKSYWEYSLIEFANNRYVALFITDANNAIATGFDNGYFPNYVIETSEENTTLNTITITLTALSQQSMAFKHIESEDDAVGKDNNTTLVPSQSVGVDNEGNVITTITCLNDTTAIYTILEEITSTGVKTNRYWVLESWYDYYFNLGFDIIGTYNENTEFGFNITFTDYTCNGQGGCDFVLTPNKYYYLDDAKTECDFYIQSTCNWTFDELPSWLNVFPVGTDSDTTITGGEANITYQIKGELKEGYSKTAKNATIVVRTGNIAYTFYIIYQPSTEGIECDWYEKIEPLSDPTAKAQTIYYRLTDWYYNSEGYRANNIIIVSGPANCGLGSISDRNFGITIPENNDELPKTYQFTVKLSGVGTPCTITINQQRKYYRRVTTSDYICDGVNKYEKVAVYYGYSASTTTTFLEYEKGNLIEEDSNSCKKSSTRWVDTDGYVCQGSDEYVLQQEEISYDSGQTWTPTGQTKAGGIRETNSPTCDSSYSWEEDGTYICENGNKYQKLVKYYKGTSTGVSKKGTLIRVNDPDCLNVYDSSFSITFQANFTNDSRHFYNDRVYIDVKGEGNWTINWGDGTSETYTGNSLINHEFITPNSSTKCVVTFNGNITYVSVQGRQNYELLSSDGSTSSYSLHSTEITAVDMTNAVSLKEFYIFKEIVENTDLPNSIQNAQNSKVICSIDLTHCTRLEKFYVWNMSGTSHSLKMPNSNTVREISVLSNNRMSTGYANLFTTARFKTNFLDLLNTDRVSTNPCIINVCPLIYNSSQVTCGQDYSSYAQHGWYVNNECCETEGSKRYRFVDGSETICNGYDKHYVSKLQVSTYTGGSWSAWTDVENTVSVGTLIEENSTDCGYTPPPTEQEEWRESPDEFICLGEHSYNVERKYISTDGGITWTPTDETRYTTIRKEYDEACGYVDDGRQYQWVDMVDEYVCMWVEPGTCDIEKEINSAYDAITSKVSDSVLENCDFIQNNAPLWQWGVGLNARGYCNIGEFVEYMDCYTVKVRIYKQIEYLGVKFNIQYEPTISHTLVDETSNKVSCAMTKVNETPQYYEYNLTYSIDITSPAPSDYVRSGYFFFNTRYNSQYGNGRMVFDSSSNENAVVYLDQYTLEAAVDFILYPVGSFTRKMFVPLKYTNNY